MSAYIGEHTWAGQLGHVLTASSFVMALLATVSFLLATQRNDDHWKRLGRLAFHGHTLAVLGIIVTLFLMLFNHWFEYDYVWKHSNLAMSMEYIASCFWEGQEGSFLLWTFWHVVLGQVLLWRWRSGRSAVWESPVMTIIALVQVFLATMILGVYIGDIRIGNSPFLLIRELEENIGLPWTTMPNYLQAIPQFADGRGLNPLLQNYWMVIHPPTLFLGFAATLIPFAYALAGLWKRDHQGWMTPALPWAFFGIMVLGTGILMGGAWAYEALSFGGFWAWDPVENASLVPWLTLVGAGHLMLVNKRKSTSLFTVYLLTLITFILVLYSTFLTRSGVLGDTSVHSFTGDGMLPGLLFFLLFFIGLSVLLLLPRTDQRRFYALISAALLVIGVVLEIPVPAILLFGAVTLGNLLIAYRSAFNSSEPEESLWSREFWLFIGSLVLLLSAVQITFSTSIPVFNLLLEPLGNGLRSLASTTGIEAFTQLADARFAPPSEAIEHYNRWQLPFAFITSMLVAFTQYLRWKDSDRRKFWRDIRVALLLAALITAVCVWAFDYTLPEADRVALLFATAFAFTANLGYATVVLKGRLKNAGPSVAHVGFALVLLGALISTSRTEEVSRNTKNMDLRFLNEAFDNNEDILLYRGDTVRMGDHFVRYREKERKEGNLYFAMDYYGVEPRDYRAGDTVRVGDMLFVSQSDHRAGDHFLADQPAHWRPVDQHTRRALWYAPEWSNARPGAAQFTLQPFIQINPRFGNVPEPDTRHWWNKDLYTHVRYADLEADADSADDGWMPDRTYDKTVGDTIVTPTAIAIIDSVYVMRDSATKSMLGERYTVYAAQMRVRDLYRSDRWFEARPVVIYADGAPVMGRAAEIPPLRVKYGLSTVDAAAFVEPSAGQRNVVKYGLTVAEAEFVVLQALMFPGINILWIGCVLLALGTGMAVWQRFRERPSKQA
ncbi:MAG: cytochrome c biogenesis protein CcsA [Flavobacteriales bacterium]|nr:cytochrome c biogenesis protein CcsA [Flavobacteriales bacterium]